MRQFNLKIDYRCKRNEKWVKILTREKQEKSNRFEIVYLVCRKVIGDAIMNYRDEEYDNGRGFIDADELDKAIKELDTDKIKALLSELSLEYIDDLEINYYLQLIRDNEIDIEELIKEQLKNRTKLTKTIRYLSYK